MGGERGGVEWGRVGPSRVEWGRVGPRRGGAVIGVRLKKILIPLNKTTKPKAGKGWGGRGEGGVQECGGGGGVGKRPAQTNGATRSD